MLLFGGIGVVQRKVRQAGYTSLNAANASKKERGSTRSHMIAILYFSSDLTIAKIEIGRWRDDTFSRWIVYLSSA